MKRAATFALAAMALSACAEPLEFADWTIEVPEGTRIIEYEHVPFEERTERIELVEDLRIGERRDEPRYAFYDPLGIAVDGAGRIYVADAGDHQVKVYDEAGNHLRSLGREGQGPGEFAGPGAITVAGSRLVVADSRVSFWDLEGNWVDETTTGLFLWTLSGRDDGTFVVRYASFDPDTARQVAVVAMWDTEGQEMGRYPTLLEGAPIFYPSARADGRVALQVAHAEPTFAVDRRGLFYLTPSDNYQVLAFAAEGAMAWALRVAYSRPPVSRHEIDRAMDIVHRRFPSAKEAEIDWPAAEPALGRLFVDGHGHLYVLPYVAPGLEPEERQVDVYSAEGERLFSGLMPSLGDPWRNALATQGDFIYHLRPDNETGEWQVVRYRLVAPFE